jgi:2-C-methyl-D-erythritol 2,4-cyclodiphosphate synthase
MAAALGSQAGAVGMARRVTDTMRRFVEAPLLHPSRGELLDREYLWAMETPQAFPRDLLLRAHEALGAEVTDDLAAVEALGEEVLLVENPFPNPKLTSPADLPYLSSLLEKQPMKNAPPATRSGIGYDIHRLEEGRRLFLGGVEIPFAKGLVGHSDADVLSHAIADAVLGAAGLADIGHYFPDTDPTVEGIPSLRIVERAVAEARDRGWRVANVDATLIAEQPKIAPYLARMRGRLAAALSVAEAAVGIKATTNEGLGSLGRGEGIAAHAVACLEGVPGASAQP